MPEDREIAAEEVRWLGHATGAKARLDCMHFTRLGRAAPPRRPSALV